MRNIEPVARRLIPLALAVPLGCLAALMAAALGWSPELRYAAIMVVGGLLAPIATAVALRPKQAAMLGPNPDRGWHPEVIRSASMGINPYAALVGEGAIYFIEDRRETGGKPYRVIDLHSGRRRLVRIDVERDPDDSFALNEPHLAGAPLAADGFSPDELQRIGAQRPVEPALAGSHAVGAYC